MNINMTAGAVRASVQEKDVDDGAGPLSIYQSHKRKGTGYLSLSCSRHLETLHMESTDSFSASHGEDENPD